MIEGYLLSIHNANRIEQLNPFSYTFTLFTLVQYNDFMRLSSTIQFIHLIVWIQSLPIYRVIKYNIFLFWTLNQTRFCQFGSSISHKFLIFILNINHTKDWNMLAKPIWVVMKWWKRVNRWLDPKSMNDQRMMVWDLEQTEKQSKHWIFNDHWTKWNECVDPMLELLTDLDKISENGRNIYEWNQINQTILEIDFDRTYWNDLGRLTFWRFGISKYDQYSIFRNTFQCHWTR